MLRDADGHIKLADFGLSAEMHQQTVIKWQARYTPRYAPRCVPRCGSDRAEIAPRSRVPPTCFPAQEGAADGSFKVASDENGRNSAVRAPDAPEIRSCRDVLAGPGTVLTTP